MSHSAAYFEHQRSSNSSSPSHYYSRPPQHPQAVYLQNTRPHAAGRHQLANSHAKNSVSSATSASTAASELKPQLPEHPYNMGPHVERAQHEDIPRRPSQLGPTWSHRTPENNEMVEDHSAVIRYLQEHEIEDDERREHDHAIWILVCHISTSYFQPTLTNAVLAVMSRSFPQLVQLYILPLHPPRSRRPITISSLPERRIFQHFPNQDHSTDISKSPPEPMRPICQRCSYFRV